MQQKLTLEQRQYVLYHLNQVFQMPANVQEYFCFQTSIENNQARAIIFLESEHALDERRVKWFEKIPILFPILDTQEVYQLDDRGNLVFNHDLIKSAFYLLSGYQEYIQLQSRDKLGRFSHTDSIQWRLKFIGRPVVNYYFNWIVSGLKLYAARHGLSASFEAKSNTFKFLLSHDVDRVDLYTFEYWVYKLKEILGLEPSQLSRKKNMEMGAHGFLIWAGLKKKENPYWNFNYLRFLEQQYGFKSTFYFLDQGVKHHDAYHSFHEARIRNLFDFILDDGCEIGLHGTIKSSDNEEVMNRNLARLRKFSKATITGNRQHRLLWKHPNTAKIIQQVGLKYDTTLGFAAHEGFRNSYCHPFRLFDFEANKMLDIWEYPLLVMDVTLFSYQRYTPDLAMKKCIELLEEVRKMNGLFTLLWHNSFFDEVTYPGVTEFYNDLLGLVASYNPDNSLGCDLVETLNANDQNRIN